MPVLAALYVSSGGTPEAEAACREAIRLDPSNALAHARLGNVLDLGQRVASVKS